MIPRPTKITMLQLEDRITPTAFVVDTLVDEAFDGGETTALSDGVGLSLREAIGLANANSGIPGLTGEIDGDTISFAPALNGMTIILASGELAITDDVVIAGGSVISISGNSASRIFNIDTSAAPGTNMTVGLKTLTLTAGQAGAGLAGGAVNIVAGSIVSIADTVISASTAQDGGGIANAGTLTITGAATKIMGNIADGVSGSGGGILTNMGNVTISNATISGNTANRAGGGIEIVDGTLALNDVVLDGNTAGGMGPIPVTAEPCTSRAKRRPQRSRMVRSQTTSPRLRVVAFGIKSVRHSTSTVRPLLATPRWERMRTMAAGASSTTVAS